MKFNFLEFSHMMKRFFANLLFVSAMLSGAVSAEQAVRSEGTQDWRAKQQDADSMDAREFAERFNAVTLLQLNLKGKTAKNAIDELGKLGFGCTLIDEQKNIVYPSKPLHPFVKCMRLLNKNRSNVRLGVGKRSHARLER